MQEDSVISKAVEILRAGGLVALPTETVYGLAADAENELAVRKIFAVKGRPSTHPLIVHLPGVDEMSRWASVIPPAAEKLARAFWPGPLTLVLRRTSRALDVVTGGQETVALRVPDHPLTRQILLQFGGGVAAPSANRFGGVSPTTAAHVAEDLGNGVELIIDGGPCRVGVESTIIDLSGAPALLRPGGITVEQIEAELSCRIPVPAASGIRVPGQMASHYAPYTGLILIPPEELESQLAMLTGVGKKVAVLSPRLERLPSGATLFQVPTQAAEYARRLYALLREVDALSFDLILAVSPTSECVGIERALSDRLRRAAFKTPPA